MKPLQVRLDDEFKGFHNTTQYVTLEAFDEGDVNLRKEPLYNLAQSGYNNTKRSAMYYYLARNLFDDRKRDGGSNREGEGKALLRNQRVPSQGVGEVRAQVARVLHGMMRIRRPGQDPGTAAPRVAAGDAG